MGDTDDKVAEAKVEEVNESVDEISISKEEIIEVVESETTKKTSTNPSEYDSADSFSDAEGEIEAKGDVQSARRRSESEDSGSVTLEREEGDGQESIQSKKVDDDEDKKNPQYIPKRGTFYEHDDRTAEDDCSEELEVPEEADKTATDKDGKKKIWTDKKEKWNHDKFDDGDQAPKSKQELIAIYGYDIRNEDGPPRARRRRRYGRGPNKYTRNWEDEDAYNKAQPVTKKTIVKKTRPGGRGSQQGDDEHEEHEEIVESHPNRTNSEEANSSGRQSTENGAEFSDRPVQTRREFTPKSMNNSYTERYNNKNQRVGTGRIVKPNREIRDSDYSGFTKPRQYTKSSHHMHDERDINVHNVQSRNYTNRKHVDMEKEMGRMSLNEPGPHGKGKQLHGNNRQGPIPPRMQTEPKGSKRYSSIRQRSMPDSSNSNFNQQTHSYYPNEFQQNPVSNSSQPLPPQPLIQAIQSQMPAIPPPPLPSIPTQVPVTTPLPPQYANPFPQPPPAFLQTAPPPFIPQPPAPMLNYVQGQPPYAPPPTPFQGYQQQYNPVQQSQATEIFQPPGGITYYSTQEQQAAQRASIQKRPKAAIPIVPPPPLEPRGRGRAMNHDNQLSMNASADTLELHADNSVYEDVHVQP